MTKKWTKERIANMTCEKRLRLYTNAKALDTDEAAEVVKMIEESGLPFSEIGGRHGLYSPAMLPTFGMRLCSRERSWTALRRAVLSIVR